MRKILTDPERKWDEVVRIINAKPFLRTDAVKYAQGIIDQATKPDRQELAMLLAAKTQVYPVAVKSEEAWEVTWAAYLEALADVPLTAVAVAFRRWDKGECHADIGRHQFYPMPAELYRMAAPYMADLKMAAYRARRFLEDGGGRDEEPWTEERKRKYREEAIAMGALTPDGKFNLKLPTFKPPRPMSHAEVVRLNQMAAAASASQAPPGPPQEEEMF